MSTLGGGGTYHSGGVQTVLGEGFYGIFASPRSFRPLCFSLRNHSSNFQGSPALSYALNMVCVCKSRTVPRMWVEVLHLKFTIRSSLWGQSRIKHLAIRSAAISRRNRDVLFVHKIWDSRLPKERGGQADFGFLGGILDISISPNFM